LSKCSGNACLPDEVITNKIYFIRGQKVMRDSDLADLHNVETKRLKEQIKRNIAMSKQRFFHYRYIT
jgi:hypothetical protein